MILERVEPGAPFSRFDDLLELVQAAFKEQEGRLDPPSSAFRETVETLRAKQSGQHLVVATKDDRFIGCVFGHPRAGDLYISKLATHPDDRGRGVGRILVDAIIDIARNDGFEWLSLEVRISLKSNQKLFSAAGFEIVEARSHEGYDEPTYYEMRCAVAP